MGFAYQCTFKKGTTLHIAWIPARGAKVGNFVDFKDGGVIDPDWEVISVGGKMNENDLKEHVKMHRSYNK